MTAVNESLEGFTNRMTITWWASKAPLSLLYYLLNPSKATSGIEMGLNILSIFFGVISSPVLLIAGLLALVLGGIAALAQTLFFPFQLLVSAIQDSLATSSEYDIVDTSPDIHAENDTTSQNGTEPGNYPSPIQSATDNNVSTNPEIFTTHSMK